MSEHIRIDDEELTEWADSAHGAVDVHGTDAAGEVLAAAARAAASRGVDAQAWSSRAVNSGHVSPEKTARCAVDTTDADLERQFENAARWNAAVMVTRANADGRGVGGHIASYASAAVLYEVGFNHVFRGRTATSSGDQVYVQGHAAPGIYARAYAEGRLTRDQLEGFRQELSRTGLPSYPHPRLLPTFWQFPTVSMGLGPLHAIYQARFNKYLTARGIKDVSDSRVFCFIGDGETDEPETLGSLSLAARDGLDNLTFVVNCNLQRLDGPVRGNGQIAGELERVFSGAGWHVIKLLWGSGWDPLFAADDSGELVARLSALPDGQLQTYSVSPGDYIRASLFDTPALAALVAHLDDEQLQDLLRDRGGHDHGKVLAAYRAAEASGRPTVILAHTIKGWRLGPDFEARNATHQMKKLTTDNAEQLAARLELPLSVEQARELEYVTFDSESPVVRHALARREQLGGFLPARHSACASLQPARTDMFDSFDAGSGQQSVATTMALVRLVKDLLKDPVVGPRIVPIIPDEARTFGMDSMFPSAKIYSPQGQTYDSVDRDLMLSYTESDSGQILHEGISEAGATASMVAAGSSYATHGEPMIPLYILYSMFGFQRVGDSLWAMADQMSRGFLIGATAGRTTLTGEGLQHADGHSQLISSAHPACVSYDPAFAYEVALIMKQGLERMYGPQPEDVFYYLTVYNEPYLQPAVPAHLDAQQLSRGVARGAYLLQPAAGTAQLRLLASGVAVPWVLEAQRLLASRGVHAEVWSVTSWTELRRDALACEEQGEQPYLQELFDEPIPTLAVSDWMRTVPDQISRWVNGQWRSLGADGFGRSDTRATMREHFGIDVASIVSHGMQMSESQRSRTASRRSGRRSERRQTP